MSSKIDQLLKKAHSFEKLAVLIDSKSFLKTIAQNFTDQEVQQYGNLDEFGNPKTNGIPAPPASPTRDPISFDRISPTRNPISFQRTSPAVPTPIAQKYKNHATEGFGQALIDKYEGTDQQPQGVPPAPPSAKYDNSNHNEVSIPTTNITGQYPSISPEVQMVLGDLVGTKLSTDGKIGDKTRAALEKFKQQYNVGNLSNAEMEKAILRKWYEQSHPGNSGAVANR